MNTDFINELNIEMLIKIKETTFDGRGYLNIERFFTTDTDVINYRLDALGDLLSNRTFFLCYAGDYAANFGSSGAAPVQFNGKR